MTTPCDSRFSLLLTFISHRLYQSSESSISCDDSNQILRDYAIREINLLLWLSFIGITVLLLRKLIVLFKLWSHGSRIPGPPSPSFYGHSVLFTGTNPHENLSGISFEFIFVWFLSVLSWICWLLWVIPVIYLVVVLISLPISIINAGNEITLVI